MPERPVGRTGVLVAALMLLVLAGCGVLPTGGPVPATSPSTERASASATPAPRLALVDYVVVPDQPDGAPILTPGDVDAMLGTPEDLRAYLADMVSQSDITDCPVRLHLLRYRTDGWAVGTEARCEQEWYVLWKLEQDGWARVADTGGRQFVCSDLQELAVPGQVAGPNCVQNDKSVAYDEMEPEAYALVVDGRYHNARFGYSCAVPDGWRTDEAQSAGDLVATDPSGRATYTCLGTNTGSGSPATTREWRDSTRLGMEEQGMEILYDVADEQTFALSGKDAEGTITYQWMVVGPGSTNGVWWRYPEDMAAELDEAVTRSVSTFRAGDLDVPH